MTRSPFSARSSFPVLTRIPLLPAADSREAVPGADALLAEGIFLASRQVGSGADLPARDRSRIAITHCGYEIGHGCDPPRTGCSPVSPLSGSQARAKPRACGWVPGTVSAPTRVARGWRLCGIRS